MVAPEIGQSVGAQIAQNREVAGMILVFQGSLKEGWDNVDKHFSQD